MKRRQTRRCVHVRPSVYADLALWCEVNGRSMSGVLEQILADVGVDKDARST